MENNSIILFDGVCNLCSGSVQWILKHDKSGYFKMASVQSEAGIALLKKYGVPADEDAVILIENNRYYSKSTAALKIARHCNGLWKLLVVFRIVPPFIRDGIYRWIAGNRYRWFGKKEECWLPDPQWNSRFL